MDKIFLNYYDVCIINSITVVALVLFVQHSGCSAFFLINSVLPATASRLPQFMDSSIPGILAFWHSSIPGILAFQHSRHSGIPGILAFRH